MSQCLELAESLIDFAALDDECLGSHIHNFTCSAHQIRLIGKHSCFAVVDDENIDMREGAFNGIRFALNPEIHCVAGDDSRPLDLFQYTQLKIRVDVA